MRRAVNPLRLWRELEVPAPVAEVVDRLGATAWVVGGAIRDRLLGVPAVSDWDVATAHEPAAFADWYPDASRRDLRFGAISFERDGMSITVATLREDGIYHDRRRPDRVQFVVDPSRDAARRDFTMNAVFARPDAVLDPYDGLGDLAARRLRAVGDPGLRLAEDPLRIWRGLRFAARFALQVEPLTLAAMRGLADAAIHDVVAARRFVEFDAAFTTAGRGGDVVRALQEFGLTAGILDPAEFDRDRWLAVTDRLDRLDRCDPTITPTAAVRGLRWATLLWEHPAPGRALIDLGAPRELRTNCTAWIDAARGLLEQARGAVRRDSRPLAASSFWPALCLARSVASPVDQVSRNLDAIAAAGPAATLLRGADVLQLGVAPGPDVGALLALALRDLPAAADREHALRVLARVVRESRTGNEPGVKGSGAPVDK